MTRVIKRLLVVGLLFWLPAVHAVPTIQHWTTKNSARVYFISAPEIPMVDVRVVFDAGGARDQGKAGLASLTNSMMSEGAGKLDANTISQKLDTIGAKLGSGSLRDMAWLSMRSLSDDNVLREAMGVMSLVLSSPTFPKDAFEREKKRMLVGYQASLQKPSTLADHAFMKAIYGDHPYASLVDGDEQSISALNLKQIRDFYQKYYVAKNTLIAIVGDINRLKAEALAEVLSGGLKPGQRAPAIPPVKEIERAVEQHIQHPSTQTHIWAGQPGMKRGDKDYFALYIGNHSFGGSGLVSVLSDEIREKRGYAYSAYSYFSPMRVLGPFQMTLQTKNEASQDALKVMRETLKDFLEKGISEDQLQASKQNLTGGFALRLDSNSKLVQYLAMIGFYDLPMDYLNTFISSINAVTQSQVNDALRRRINPDKMVTITVGPAAVKTVSAKQPKGANSSKQ